MASTGSDSAASTGPRLGYWVAVSLVVAYVALCTGYRDEWIGADAWEHQRAVRVLAEVGLDAGNPTYDAPEPSIRYSPYSVALALAARAAHADSYRVLSAAAIANTALLFVALYLLLAAYGRQASAVWVLAPMLFLYGAAPGYANSLALEDLPVHQVNPSAFSLALDLCAWALWRWTGGRGARLALAVPLCACLISVSLLCHGMTGFLGALGLGAVSAAEHGGARLRLLGGALASAGLAAGLALLWPWYSFARALGSSPDLWFWYNPYILRRMLFVWCLPCCAAALLALPQRADDLVRACFVGLGASLALGVAAIAVRSPTLGRLPLAGLIFAQLLAGQALWRWDLARVRSLGALVDALCSLDPAVFAGGALRALLFLALTYTALPQLWDVFSQPQLLRPRVAGLLGRDPKQRQPLASYRSALEPVAEHDVVLGDPVTAWPVPSVHGRVVAALHLEFFVPGQRERWDSAEEFFAPDTDAARRREILARWGVRWLLLDRERDAEAWRDLRAPACTVREHANLALLDAGCWAAQSLGSPGRQNAR